MKFKRSKIRDSLGCILAHSIKTKNGKLKKGQIISKIDIKELLDLNIENILVGQLDKDEVTENKAANIIANSIISKNIYKKQAFTGRCNLYSKENGVLEIPEQIINKINFINESITIATLPMWSLVKSNQMIATIKIIPFATKLKYLKKAQNYLNKYSNKLKVHKLKNNKIGIIYTKYAHNKTDDPAKKSSVINSRIISLGSTINKEIICEHNENEIASSLKVLIKHKCNPILIYGASAIIDRSDVVPTGIKICGGQIDHFGMPVDPGNLLLLGRVKNTKIIGIPSCAKSPKLNGFDWVLWRILSGLNIQAKDIQSLGVGGLLKEIPSRPQPREEI